MAAIAITDVTSGIIDGTGDFDKLMTVVDALLQNQFDQNRIKSTDYASVYLGAIQSAMAQSIAFVLSKQKSGNEADLIVANTTNANAQSAQDLLNKAESLLKTTSEIALLTQKTDTEKAQILDIVNTLSVVGVIGKQKLLFTAQTDGFARDAEQKALKIMLDVYAVQRTTDIGAVLPNNASAPDIGAFIKVAGDGINVLGLT